MYEFLQTLPGILIILFVGTGWLLVTLTRVWAENWRDVRLAEQATELKAKLVERGMSADEIERVVQARPSAAADDDDEPIPPASDRSRRGQSPVFALVYAEMDAKEIARVIEGGLPLSDSPADVTRWMAEYQYGGDDIARVLGAMQARARERSLADMARDEARPMPAIDLEVRANPTAPAGVGP
jgi:hypothetical protein